jgi:hypothetical protein
MYEYVTELWKKEKDKEKNGRMGTEDRCARCQKNSVLKGPLVPSKLPSTESYPFSSDIY